MLIHCDNEAAVAVINSGSSRDAHIMHLLRSLFFVKALFGISLRAVHIKGSLNAISRGNLSPLFSQVPSASPAPTPIPPDLLSLLVLQKERLRGSETPEACSTLPSEAVETNKEMFCIDRVQLPDSEEHGESVCFCPRVPVNSSSMQSCEVLPASVSVSTPGVDIARYEIIFLAFSIILSVRDLNWSRNFWSFSTLRKHVLQT